MVNQDKLNKMLLKVATVENLNMVKLLIDTSSAKGLEMVIYHSGVFCWAATNNHLDIVKFLVESGVNINDKNLLGYTPLMCAVQEGHTAIKIYLESKGAK